MSQIYAQRTREKAPGMRTGGPSVAELAAGARPTAEQMGSRVDLPGEIREKMENSFGADFSKVKLYESDTVAEAGAEAVTQGTNIVFAPGKLDLASTAGQALLGHELSHVVSQSRGESAGQGFLNDAHLEAQADWQGMMAAQGQSVYTGAVSPIGASAAASAAGPMQAKKKSTELAEGEAARRGMQLPSGIHFIRRGIMKSNLLRARMEGAQRESQRNGYSLPDKDDEEYDDMVDFWSNENFHRENDTDTKNAQDANLTNRLGDELAIAKMKYNESIRDALLEYRGDAIKPMMMGKPMEEPMEQYFNSLVAEASKIEDADQRKARVGEIYNAFANSDRGALTGMLANDVQNMKNSQGFMLDLMSPDKNKALDAYENNLDQVDKIRAMKRLLLGSVKDVFASAGANELGLMDPYAPSEVQEAQRKNVVKVSKSVDNRLKGVDSFDSWIVDQRAGRKGSSTDLENFRNIRTMIKRHDIW